MNRYNPNIHHRRSIRLIGYDYLQAGLYFVTIVCQHRKHFFGEIENEKMKLTDSGKMVEKWYYELENKFPDIKCHKMIVMPNHFHCIIENVGTNANTTEHNIPGDTTRGEHVGSPLSRMVQWFKTMTTNEYIRGVKNKNWQPFDGKLWQRNYWEHIIRNEKSYNESGLKSRV